MRCIVNKNVVRDKSVVVLVFELTLIMLRNLLSKGLTAGDIHWENWQKSRTSWCDFQVLFLFQEYEGQEWVRWEGASHIDIREYFWILTASYGKQMFPNPLFLANAGKDLPPGLLKLLSSVVIDFRCYSSDSQYWAKTYKNLVVNFPGYNA